MNTKYTIKNFRVFDEKGVTVDIKPITILTGCNSSGKSSIVKSMVLLDTYIDSLVKDYWAFKRIDLRKFKLDFTKENTFSLGNFNRVLHRGSEDKTLTFQYQVHSSMLGEDVLVSLCFETDKNDTLCQGYLYGITISMLSGEILYTSSKEEACSADYSLIFNHFFRFAFGQFLVSLQEEYKARRKGLYGLQTVEEFHDSLKGMPPSIKKQEEETEKKLLFFKDLVDKYESTFLSTYGKDSLLDIRSWMTRNGNNHNFSSWLNDKKPTLIEKWTGGNIDVVGTSLKYNTFFFFPLLEKLYAVDAKSFKSTLLEMIEGISSEKEVLLAIDKITDDFISSGKETFGEYFKMKEASFLKLSDNAFARFAPYIDGIRFLRIESPSFTVEGYLNWSRRMLGPVATEFEGNIVSLIGMGEEEEWENCPTDFSVVYDVLMNINYLLDPSVNDFYEKKEINSRKKYLEFNHNVFDMFKDFTSTLVEDIVISEIPHKLSYVTTSLVNVRREYSLDSNDNFSSLVKRYFIARREYRNSNENEILGEDNFISRWVRRLGVGYSVSIEVSNSGSSFVVRLFKDEDDKTGTILAEEGYGITQIVTLLIRIETEILESRKMIDWDEQDKPVYSFSESTIAIEEPEVHLHPMFQSLLAEMFVDAYTNYNVHFVIETHSEYLIRKLQTKIAKKELSNKDISIVYVYDPDISKRPLYVPQVKMIEVNPDGRLNDSFGEGFFDEADRLSMSLLDIKVKNDEKE